MATVVDLTDDQLSELRRVTNETDNASAVRTAAVEYLRYMKRMRLKELSGKVTMEDNWRELEQLEMKSGDFPSGSGSD